MSRAQIGALTWIGLLSIWVFFPSYDGFIWDDQLLVLNNGNTSGWTAFGRLWTEDLWARVPGEHAHHWYRPLMTLTLWIDHQLFGQNITAAISHSAVYAILCATLFWKLLRNWKVETSSAILGMVFFCLHPLQIEGLRFIAARNDLMSMAAMLATAHLLSKNNSSLLIFGTTLMALLSKESSVLILPLLLLAQYTVKQTKPNRIHLLAMGTSVAIWFLLRWNAVSTSPELEILEAARALPVAAACLVVPIKCPAAAPPLELTSLSLFGLIPLMAFAFIGIRRNKVALAAATIGFPSLCLASQAAVLSNGMAHRYLLWPLLALSILVATVRLNKMMTPMSALLGLGLAIVSKQHTAHWKSTIDLWTHAHTQFPSSQSACGLFKQFEKANQHESAFPYLIEAVTAPVSPHCCFNASRYPFSQAHLESTIYAGQYALQQGCPQSPELLAPLAMAEALSGNWSDAKTHAGVFGTDPWGFGPVILAAEGMRRGDEKPLIEWTQHAGQTDTEPLRLRAQKLIEQADRFD